MDTCIVARRVLIGVVKNSVETPPLLKTINKIIRYRYENHKYQKIDYEYDLCRCPVFKLPNEPVKTYTSKNKLNKDYLNSTADFE